MDGTHCHALGMSKQDSSTLDRQAKLPRRRKMALTRQRQGHVAADLTGPLKRSPQLQGGSPCLHFGNTTPSWVQTNRPSNWQIQRCNRMEERWCLLAHSHRLLGQDNLCHALSNTTASCPQTSPAPSWRIHLRNCMGPQAQLVLLAWAVEGSAWALLAAQWAGTHGGAPCSTRPFCPPPMCSLHPLHN